MPRMMIINKLKFSMLACELYLLQGLQQAFDKNMLRHFDLLRSAHPEANIATGKMSQAITSFTIQTSLDFLSKVNTIFIIFIIFIFFIFFIIFFIYFYPFHPFLPIFIHFYTFPSVFIHFHPVHSLLSTFIHLVHLSTFFNFRLFSPTFIPLYYRLLSIFSTVIHFNQFHPPLSIFPLYGVTTLCYISHPR